MPDVPYTSKNAALCKCYACPVQKDSACAQEKVAKVYATLATADPPPPPADLPGMYCASGIAKCTDLDIEGLCQCMSCAVYRISALDQWKYCNRGPASQIG
jgi:hypothetical protein